MRARQEISRLLQGADGVTEESYPTRKLSEISNASKTSKKDPKALKTENEKLENELQSLKIELKMTMDTVDRHDNEMRSCQEEIRRLETANLELKSRATRAETDHARVSIENQRLLQKIVGMEENQAMMSRAELHSMITQLEEAEVRAANKPAAELSGIRTNPSDMSGRKRSPVSQEDKQLSWRLSRTEARLSQSLDENRRLREDLKEMLDSQVELQQSLLADPGQFTVSTLPRSSSANARLNRHPSGSDSECQTDDVREDIDDVILRLAAAERENDCLKENYTVLQEIFENLLKRIDDIENKRTDIVVHSKNNIATSTEDGSDNRVDIEILEKRITEQEAEQIKWKENNETLTKICQALAARVDTVYNERENSIAHYAQLTNQNKVLRTELDKKVKEIEQLLNEKNSSNNETRRLQDEARRLAQQLQKRKDTDTKPVGDVENIERELSDVKRKYEEANRRLKELANTKSVQPTKSLDLNTVTPVTLAERFRSELYEREWRQAFALVSGKWRRDEKKAIQILGEICTEAYLYCKRTARLQMDNVTSSLVEPTANHFRSATSSKRNGHTKSLIDQIPEDLRRRLAHFRCRPTDDMLAKGVQDFLNQIDYDRTRFLRHVSEQEFHELMPYISLCFELSWCMASQEPPMYLLFKVRHGLDIEPDKFDTYQSNGKRVDYILWPAVFLEEGGACLQRGVAYTLPERS
ncbi:myosin-9-like isoform X2 [Dreissena polymorpha]|uniref:Mitochondria-eating protein C-terminal domain-containing protein n=1 Tax=Dreissena polymorpha TaxID=45954 RepID=A0A9D4KNY5_DREPO|nr:myosin-9-like isoform X2 [Dreissena polymorpha]KAH3843440.1 hypothetical protein DPMN_116958 [Dreissena polymorpha]